MRLAFVGDPNSIHVRRWMGWFVDHGHEVALLEGFGTDVGHGLDPRIRVERYTAGRARIPGLGARRTRAALRKALRSVDAQLLHAHFVRRFGWQAAAAGFHPFVVSGWGSDVLVPELRTWRVRWRDRRTFASADLVTVTNPYMRDAIVANGAARHRVALIQHGVDTRRFAPGRASSRFLLRHDVVGRPVILSPRAIRPLYRHETVLDAFARTDPPAVLVMSALDADADVLHRLRARAAELGVADRVRILDRIEHDELPDAYRAASAVVSVPQSDSFPVTLLEAMATGTPVVVGDLPPTRAVLAAIAPDALVEVGDVAGTALALRRALALAPEERRALAERLRAWVVREADYDANMREMERHYRRLIGR